MSNEVATTEQRRPALRAGGGVTAIVPQSIEEAYRLANAVVSAGMAPKSFDGSADKAMIAIMHGMEVGLTPMAALQSIAVVNGFPTIWGDGALGLVRGSGLCEWVKEWAEGEGETYVAHCEIKRRGEPEPIRRSFSYADAKAACLLGKKGPWESYRSRMFQMRARSYALRDGFADVLRGLRIAEEVEDYRPFRNEPEPRPSIASRFEGKTLEAPEGFDHGHVQRQIADARGEDPITETAEPDGDVAPSSAPSGSRSAPGSAGQLPDDGYGDTEPQEPAGGNLPADVFRAYHEALRRFDAVEKLEKAADRFWPDNGGWPPASKDDKRLALKIFDAHKNRVDSGVGHEDTNAHVGELIMDAFGEFESTP